MSYADTLLSTGEEIRTRDRQHWWILVWAGRWAIIAIVGGIVLMLLATSLQPDGVGGAVRSIAGFVFAALIIIGVANIAWEALKYRYQEYIITNRRVIQVGGVINKHSTDSSLEKINDAQLSQSIFGRMFGFGDLDVLTASESGIDRFQMIHDPIGFKRAMLDAKHDYEMDMARGPVPSSPPLRATPEPPPERAPETVGDETTSVPLAAATAGAGAGQGAPVPPSEQVTHSPPTVPTPPPMSADDVTRTLASLADLRDRGAISPEEYEQKKAELLGRI